MEGTNVISKEFKELNKTAPTIELGDIVSPAPFGPTSYDTSYLILPSSTALRVTDDGIFKLEGTMIADTVIKEGDNLYLKTMDELSGASGELREYLPIVYMSEVLSYVYCIDEMHDRLLSNPSVDRLNDWVKIVFTYKDYPVPAMQDFMSAVKVRLCYKFPSGLFYGKTCVKLVNTKDEPCAIVVMLEDSIGVLQYLTSGAYLLSSIKVPRCNKDFSSEHYVELVFMLLKGLLAYCDIIIDRDKFLSPASKDFDSIIEFPWGCEVIECVDKEELLSGLHQMCEDF